MTYSEATNLAFNDVSSYNKTVIFYGPFGMLNEFNGTGSGAGWMAANYSAPYQGMDVYIPTWSAANALADATGGVWYGSRMEGKFSDNIIANVCVVNYTPMTEEYSASWGGANRMNVYTPGKRIFAVQAQALDYSSDGGTRGKNFIAKGNNGALSETIKNALELAYSENLVSSSAIKACNMSIDIVK